MPELGFKGQKHTARQIPGIPAADGGNSLLGVGRALLSVSKPLGDQAKALAAKQGDKEGAIAAADATRIDPKTGTPFPGLVQAGGTGAFSEAFNRQSEKIYAQRLEVLMRARINKLSLEFAGQPEAMREAITTFGEGLKESAQVPPEMEASFNNAVATLSAPHINSAFGEVNRQAEKDAEAGRKITALSRTQSARPLGRIIGSGGPGSLDALDLFGKVMLQHREDLNQDVVDLRMTPNEANLQFLAFQSEAAKELVKGMSDGSSDKGALARDLKRGTLTITMPVPDEETGELVAREVNFDELLLPRERDALGSFLKTGAAADEKVLRSRVKDAITVLEAGKTPSDLDELLAVSQGTPELSKALVEATEESGFMNEYLKLAPTAQRETFDTLEEKETHSARDIRRLGAMGRGQVATLRSIKENPLGHAAEVGATTEIEPLEFSDPESLRRREAQADMAGAFLGLEVSPLMPGEAAGIEAAIDEADVAGVAGIFRTMRAGFSSQAIDQIAGQVAPKRPALAVALSVADLNPGVAGEIVRGERLVEQVPEVKPGPAEIEPEVASIYGNLFQETESALAPHIDAATAIYAARKVPTGDLSFDEDLYSEALQLAAGGTIDANGTISGGPIEFNGQKILPPLPGMTEDELVDLVSSLAPDGLLTYGNGEPVFADGTPFDPELFDAGFFQNDARLLSVGRGQYRIFVPGLNYVFTPTGEPYLIDLRRAAQATP